MNIPCGICLYIINIFQTDCYAALSMINYEIDNHDLDQNFLHRIEVQRQIPSCDIFTTINVLDLQARYVGKRNSDCIIKEVGCRTKEI